MIPAVFREGINNLRLYDDQRAKALQFVEWPPPAKADTSQFAEAYADLKDGYDFTRPDANPIRRSLVFWSDSLYSSGELRAIVPDIIPLYGKFDGIETVKMLTELYPQECFLPGRELSVVIYVVNVSEKPLKAPTESERKKLGVSEYSFYKNGRRVFREAATLRLWWDLMR